jgi:predicted alpha-1,6-mannanase (GH76 family)
VAATGASVNPQVHAARAVRAYAAMRRHFLRRDGLYRRDGRPRPPGMAAHLWPTARAFVAAVDLLGVRRDLRLGLDAASEVDAHLRVLENYWDDGAGQPAYASDVIGSRFGGDRYYDDNAWVGLGLVQLERLRPGRGHAERARALFRFAEHGWDARPDVPSPGGVFWVEQTPPTRGAGVVNHDRNVVSNAPNAQLGLHLAELTGGAGGADGVDGGGDYARARDMYAWVNVTLDAGRASGAPATGLFFDKLRGDGTLDETLWTYNQGSMIGANILLARQAGVDAPYLARADAIAAKALRHYGATYAGRPAAFNAILFRNLLQLHAATADAGLRARIRSAMSAYAGLAWTARRDRHDRFRFGRGGPTLLDQSAMVQVFALLAWDPADYRSLA